jgi:hypothetical protein
VLSFFLKATPLRAKSALQEASDADAAAAASDSSTPGAAQTDNRDETELELQLGATRAAETFGALVEPQTGSVPAQRPKP